MKEAIGGVSLFQIVVVLILVFTAVMCLTINHSKAFGVKDEIINMIENGETENYNGSSYNTLSSETIQDIINYINDNGYKTSGKCPDSDWTGYNIKGTPVSDNAVFCIKAHDVADSYYSDVKEKCKRDLCNSTSGDFPKMIYYEVALFYQIDVPILNDILDLRLYGSTKVLFG